MTRNIMAAFFLLWFTSMAEAQHECTAEDVQAKHQQFMDVVVIFSQKYPDKYQEVSKSMRMELPELQKLGDLNKLCGFYETWTEKMR